MLLLVPSLEILFIEWSLECKLLMNKKMDAPSRHQGIGSGCERYE